MEFLPPVINWPVIVVACSFMLLDLITGFVGACVNNCVQSTKMKDGLFHKLGFILAIVLGCLCEYAMGYVDLGFPIPIQISVCTFIILTEIVSNLENLGRISPELSSSKFMSIFKREGDE